MIELSCSLAQRQQKCRSCGPRGNVADSQSDDTFLNGTYLNGSTVNRTIPEPEPTLQLAPQPASAARLAASGSLLLLTAGAAVLL